MGNSLGLAPGEQLYVPSKNPHLTWINIGNGWIWRCKDCQMLGSWEALSNTECPVIPPPCSWCGHVAICAWDCMGIALILSDPQVHIIDTEKTEGQHDRADY